MLLYKLLEQIKIVSQLVWLLQEWADDWKMNFNVLKCQHISFCSKRVQINFRYMIYNEVIKQVDSIKYLGKQEKKIRKENDLIDKKMT